MPQLENIEAIEKRLWNAADNLRANSNYASNEYFMPVMGLIFLRHAYSRFLAVKDSIQAGLPQRGGKTRELTKADFSQKSSIFLRPIAQFDYLVDLPDSADRAKALMDAMDSIEADYVTLRGILPKSEYQELDNAVLGQLLRQLNPEELKRASGDIFGRIYEYFLTQFADQKAHDGGEFFTPVSLVSLIANVLEPERGKVLDPACGSGGMFVQSAHFVERMNANPAERLTFYGLEKNPTTIRLAKMNLAVHGLEGDIQKAISYYEDPHELLGMLTHEVKFLVESFWEGLRCDVMVPCIEPCGKNIPGTGLYNVSNLIESKRDGQPKYPCPACNKWQDIDSLLGNAPAAAQQISLVDLQSEFAAIKDKLDEVNVTSRRILSQVDKTYTDLLQVLTDEAKEGPRLFSFFPVDRSAFNPKTWIREKFRLVLWCEHSRLPLPVLNNGDMKKGVYDLELEREWFKKASPYLKILTGTLGMVLPVASSAVKLALDETAYKLIEEQLDFGKSIIRVVP